MTTTLLHHAWLPTHLRSRGIGLRTHWRFLIHRPHKGARDISSVCIALAFRLVVRLCASMAHIVHMSVSVDTTAPCSICLLGVCLRCFSVPKWKNIRTCGCLMAPQGGITLTTRVFRTPHHTLSSSCNLVRAHLPLCRYWPPHGSHMVQRLQALCLAHKLHTVQSVHKFGRAPLAPSEVTVCQPRSLRPPRNSHLLNSWSAASTHSQVRMVPTCTTPNDLLAATLSEAATQLSFAAFLEHCIFVNASPLPQLPVPTPSLDAATQTFSHRCLPDVSTQLSFREFLAPPSTLDVRCPACARSIPSLHTDAAVQTPLHSVATHDAPTQQALTEFFIGCILSNDPLAKLCRRHIALLVAPRRLIASLCSPQQCQPCQ